MKIRPTGWRGILMGIGVVVCVASTIATTAAADVDGDGVEDAVDNCVETPNGPLLNYTSCPPQYDYDGDGYGNACDGDFNNDGIMDLDEYKLILTPYHWTTAPEHDLDCNGRLDMNDANLFLLRFNLPPGPAGGL